MGKFHYRPNCTMSRKFKMGVDQHSRVSDAIRWATENEVSSPGDTIISNGRLARAREKLERPTRLRDGVIAVACERPSTDPEFEDHPIIWERVIPTWIDPELSIKLTSIDEDWANATDWPRKSSENWKLAAARYPVGSVHQGVVTYISDHVALIKMEAGIEGLLHVTDMAWRCVNDPVNYPSEFMTINETIKVQVIQVNKETHQIKVGMKHLQDDPWDLVAARYPVDSVHQGIVGNIMDYGAFIEMEAGITGLLHVSEMSSTKGVHPSEIVSKNQKLDVMILKIDNIKKRMSLGLTA